MRTYRAPTFPAPALPLILLTALLPATPAAPAPASAVGSQVGSMVGSQLGSMVWSAAVQRVPLGSMVWSAAVQRVAVEVVAAEVVPVEAGWRWPLAGVPRVARRFDPPPLPWQPGHRGVDLEGEAGASVRAAGPGVVLYAGRVAGTPVVSVSHVDGLRTTYQPVEPAVRVGDRIAAGDPIGTLLPGHPGCLAGVCLHWGLRRAEHYLDPLALLNLARVRLLPLTARHQPP
ncbi:M23 family metallopeptidase [Micromonospora sp. NBC_01699]|uniref:murein hydrolase activator EnvC family protein n=1 Tax=Micromonospora sp. NBC_01699 TaxID=2975984 RepID=UPI002E31604E|nr:M23 family metallopeptidase [Micromonospora sp. NBC_01699]